MVFMPRNIVLNIQRFCIHDGPGIRTVVFLKGCPMTCSWCANPASQNPAPEPVFFSARCQACGQCDQACSAITFDGNSPQIDRSLCNGCGKCAKACPSKALEIIGLEMSPEEVVAEIQKDSVFYRNSGGGLTLSGGEPLMQPNFAKEILRQCSELGINTAVETAGCLPWENFEKIRLHTDLFLYDLKHLADGEHMRATGKGNTRIIENLKALCKTGSQVILRMPIIPDFNDSEAQIDRLAELCLDLGQGIKQVELLPYHNLGTHKYDLLGKTYELHGLKIPDKEHLLGLAGTLEKNIKQANISCRAVFGTVTVPGIGQPDW